MRIFIEISSVRDYHKLLESNFLIADLDYNVEVEIVNHPTNM